MSAPRVAFREVVLCIVYPNQRGGRRHASTLLASAAAGRTTHGLVDPTLAEGEKR